MPHIHHLYDFVVAMFIVHDDKILMVNHPRYGYWLAPGGHIELNEDPDQALFRELEEETGYKPDEVEVLSSKPDIKGPGVTPLYTPNYIDAHDANAPHRHIALVYFVKVSHENYSKSDEHTDAKWFSLSEIGDIKDKTPPDTMFFAKEALKLAKNT